ncbi:MAG: LCP family protein [Saccharofermentanales bacterium]
MFKKSAEITEKIENQKIIGKRFFKVKYAIISFISLILIFALGISIYIWQLLDKPIQTIIPIVSGRDVSEGILDDLDEIDDNSDAAISNGSKNGNGANYVTSWGNGRVKLFVDPDFPIFMVPQKDPNVENILLIGIDARSASERQSRTDSILVVSIDKNNRSIKLTSFMRDTQVKIPGRSNPTKINSAYAYGGIGLLINTLNSNFDLDIQKFAMVDMLSSENIINAAGGVTIDVNKNEIRYINGGVSETNRLFKKFSKASPLITKSGLSLLDGRQAVAYGRIRYIGNDQERTLRQRTVLSALIISFKASPISRKMTVFNESFRSFETNMSKNEMLFLAFDALLSMKNIYQYRVPENGMFTTNSTNYQIIIDFSKQNPALHDFIWGNVPKNTITMPEELPDPSPEVSESLSSSVNRDMSPPPTEEITPDVTPIPSISITPTTITPEISPYITPEISPAISIITN